MPGWYLQQRAERFLGVEPGYLNRHPQGGLIMTRALTALVAENEAEELAAGIAQQRAKMNS
jgi:hypothetical protein